MPANLFPHAAFGQYTKKDAVAGRDEEGGATLPKGVVLGPDGKPCRTCTSSAAWIAMMKSSTSPSTKATSDTTSTSNSTLTETSPQTPAENDCPPDVEQLGRSTWTLLHSLTATYPPQPTQTQQTKVRSFLSLFADLYPCWVCAEDFKSWMAEPENTPRLSSQEEFGRWMCSAHNAVNEKLGKERFNCDLWRQRWKDGWKDGRCD